MWSGLLRIISFLSEAFKLHDKLHDKIATVFLNL